MFLLTFYSKYAPPFPMNGSKKTLQLI